MGEGHQGIGGCAGVSFTSRVTPISGLGAKGPACYLVETPDARLLLDLGYGPVPGVWPDISNVGRVDALLLSHSHADHAGALTLRAHAGNPPVFATDIVRRLLDPSIETFSLPLHDSLTVCGVRLTTGRNGHAPGGIWLHLDVGRGLLYMGDYSVESALYAYDDPPPAHTVILDASYGAYDRSLAECIREFDRVFDEAPALLPVPAAGRGPEIALHIERSGRMLPAIDESIRSALRSFVSENRSCIREDAQAGIQRIAEEAPAIDRARGVMLASSADGTRGEAARLIERWEHETTPHIVFSGYLPPGTPAERLTQSGRASYMRWNVHPRLADNIDLVHATNARVVLPAFGEARHLDAWKRAFAPAQVSIKGTAAL